MTKLELQNRVSARIDDLIVIAERELRIVVERPNITYRIRGSSAGYAEYATRTIDLNMIYLRDNADAYIANSVPHELAHLIVQDIHGNVPFQHGREWQALMQMFDAKVEITHRYDTAKTVKTYQWNCGCMSHQLSYYQHTQARKGKAYECNKCKQAISVFSA